MPRAIGAIGVMGAVAVVAAIGVALPFIVSAQAATLGWRDLRTNYPPRPSGYSEIVATFGQPCSAAASYVHRKWTAADNGVTYDLYFHRKLGGMGTNMLSDQGGRSTNLDNDVYGQIIVNRLSQYLKSGIYGYACRTTAGSTSWSTHAWGIAVDVSSAYEPSGNCGSNVNYMTADIWKNHNWHWGRTFCDSMHFQYAINY